MSVSAAAKNPAKFFVRQDVMNILVRVTGFDVKKIFAAGFNPKLKTSEIQLLTKEQLDAENKKALESARRFLQMPPYLQARKRIDSVLAKDDRLSPLNLTNSKYMFIDISMNLPDDKRSIVVRETNGTLRKANYDEREKMLQTYFPKKGNTNYVPQMFEPAQLEECLKQKKYMILLKKACNIFEPNDPNFLRVTHRIYQHVSEAKDFDILHSTRFFGPMVFYLAWNNQLDHLLAHMLNNANVPDALSIIRLFFILKESIAKLEEYSNESKNTDLELIEMFIKKELKNGSSSQLAIQKILASSSDDQKQQVKQ